MPTPLNNELDLLRQIADGDEKAFRIFFDHYKERFYAVVLKMTRSEEIAEEIVQEVFLKIWQKRETLRDIEHPGTYFFTAVYRRVFRHYKKMAFEHKLLQGISRVEGMHNITDEAILATESERLIKEGIAKLPPQQQMVFRLSKQQGLSREEIAEQMNISPNTVRNHLADAIKFLRTYLGNSIMLYVLIELFLSLDPVF